ncbi:MAG: PIG-L deacetylase family protein [Candidatus Nitrosotenuis sp.]
MSKILVISAHPDDETLGLGGTIALNVKNKNDVFVLVFTDGQYGRDDSKRGILKRRNQAKKACTILGVKNVKFLNYKDQRLDTIPLVTLARDIELSISSWNIDTVFTHFWGDVNQDHKRLFEATLIATRPHPKSQVKTCICYETPSSTDWGNKPEGFNPNLFVDIDGVVTKKIHALEQYADEMGEFPHPRSKESVINRAKYWGSAVGIKYAETFTILREIR